MDDFIQKRNQFYGSIPQFWDRLYGTEYALFDCYELKKTEVDAIRVATKSIFQIFKKVNHLVLNSTDDAMRQLGIPEKAIPFIKMRSIPTDTVIGRFDFVMTNSELKVIEFNSDTPTFIRECFEINNRICEEFGLEDPNQHQIEKLAEAIRQSVLQSAAFLGIKQHPYVVFTAHDDDIEDRETMKFLMDIAKIKEASFVPLQNLQIISNGQNKGVYDTNGKKIDIVYRHTYPMEALLEDMTDDQYPIGLEFMKLVHQGYVAILNPISAFFMQSKAVMALIWGLYEEKNDFFSETEREIIQRYFLPTYLDEEPFLLTNDKYVSKPIFGREGDTVEIRKQGHIIYAKCKHTYEQYDKIFQKYVELPTTTIRTEQGEKQAHLLIGSFVINEKPSAIGIRAGSKVTDNLSYYLPCYVKGE